LESASHKGGFRVFGFSGGFGELVSHSGEDDGRGDTWQPAGILEFGEDNVFAWLDFLGD